MNYLKTIFITTILLSMNTIFGEQDYQAYTQEQPMTIEEPSQPTESVIATISQEEAPVKENIIKEETVKKEKTAVEIWNDHLDKLKTETKQWDSSNNVPESSWTTEAITLAKNALDKDHAIAETLKSAFFDAISTKIDLEKGKFGEKTFALITEFNEAIDAKLKTISDTETALQAAKTVVLEETKPEPVAEATPTPIETAPEPVAEEGNKQETTTTTGGDNSKDLLTQWYDLLYKVETEGTTLSDTKGLLSKTYELARQLLSEGLRAPQDLYFDLEYVLYDRSESSNMQLFPINSTDAIKAFSEATGIPLQDHSSYDQRSQASEQRRAAAEQEIKRKEQQTAEKQMIAQKALDIAREREGEQKQESTIQKLQLQYQQKLALFQAEARAETDAKLEKLRQELKTAKAQKASDAPQGILGTAIGAVRGAASAASRWWYGTGETQDAATSLEEDKERLKKLHALLDVLALTNNEKADIEKAWTLFIGNLRSAPQLSDKANAEANKKWIATTGQALETLLMQYHIISIEDARDIIESIIESSPNRTQVIKEIKRYLEERKLKIIQAKQQKEAAILKKAQQKEERKKIVMREQQKIKDEENRTQEEKRKQLLVVSSYKNEKSQWKQLLADLSHNKQATTEKNNAQMREAIKKSQSLLTLASQIPSKNRPAISQKLKQKFTVALLEQQKLNGNEINIHQNMDQFNKEINKIVE